jgi:hypothetical protein
MGFLATAASRRAGRESRRQSSPAVGDERRETRAILGVPERVAGRLLAAAWLGKTRLIDNVPVAPAAGASQR